jgi:hypothetical protein
MQEAEALVEQCLGLAKVAHENGWATPQLYYRLAEIHAARGDVASAVSQLQAAYERGWRDIRSLEGALFWRDLGADPEIERIKVLVYEDIERQRRKLTT